MNVSLGVATALKYLGLWFITLAGLLVYGETAPSNPLPDFSGVFLALPAGLALFYTGCWGCRRAQRALENT